MKSITLSLQALVVSVIALGAVMFMVPDQVSANQVVWNSTYPSNAWLRYYDPTALMMGPWLEGIYAPTAGVTYNANIYSQTTGSLIPHNSTISVGDKIEFRPEANNNIDIKWSGSSGPNTTPYGHWATGAAFSSAPCSAPEHVGSGRYTSLSVAPPSVTYTNGGTAGLSCNAAGNLCTVTSAGNISASVNFGATYGKFYYSDYNVFDGCKDWGVMSPDWNGSNTSINIPTRSINFTLTAVGGNTPPNAPTISGPYTGPYIPMTPPQNLFDFTSTDPDGDAIRYEIDWDNNGTVDQILPSSGHVPSGTTENTPKSWSVPGDKTFQARTSDNMGANSAWVSHVVTQTVDTSLITISPALLDFGNVLAGNRNTLSFTITNGPEAVVGNVNSIAGDYNCISGCNYNLSPGEVHEVDIFFEPIGLGRQDSIVPFDFVDFTPEGGVINLRINRDVTGVGIAPPECNDGIDNDSDGFIDFPADPGCTDPTDNYEDVPPECDDLIDNDGDGNTDHITDPGCSGPADDDETNPPQCNDGIDNDGDTFFDFPADPGCTSLTDDDETDPPTPPQCNDGLDNDDDTLIDMADIGCTDPTDDDEVDPVVPPQCNDGLDNDGDGFTDHPADVGCTDPTDDDDETDPPSPSGNITFTPNPCIILAGDSTCNSSVNWNSYDFINPVELIRQGTSPAVDSGSAGNDSGSVPQTFSLGATLFELKDGSDTVDTKTITVGCVAGSVWADSQCVALPNISMVADTELVRKGDTAEVTITIESTINLNCTLSGALSGPSFGHTDGTNPVDYPKTTSPLTSTRLARVDCVATDPALSAIKGSADVTIEVVPEYQEI